MADSDRSISRGRDYQSTGRGGLGNFRQSSTSREPGNFKDGPDDFSPTRGREPRVHHFGDDIYSTGRGGSGNIRSRSRDVLKLDASEVADESLVRERITADETAIHSTGRGGLGNINRSRSREPRSPVTPVHSSGRGGAGNIHTGLGKTETIDEEERKQVARDHASVHLTGRGGAANLTATAEPPVEHHHHKASEFESSGRGGVGNIVHSSS